jgi:hypothetical protein
MYRSEIPPTVMAGHSASKDARERAYVPATHDLFAVRKTWMPATCAGMTEERSVQVKRSVI